MRRARDIVVVTADVKMLRRLQPHFQACKPTLNLEIQCHERDMCEGRGVIIFESPCDLLEVFLADVDDPGDAISRVHFCREGAKEFPEDSQ
eukprot:1143269-Amorphochlora_amoeboformis.AAC.1